MSQITALMLCLGAVAIGFLVASICQAARIEDDAAVYWNEGREYGYRMGVEAERRAMRPVALDELAEPFDWEREQAKSKHPSTWTEAHADRGPWPA